MGISKELKANIMLFVTAIIWGGGFVAQRLGMQEMEPYLFNGFRFLIGSLTLTPFIVFRKKRYLPPDINSKNILLIGAAAGCLLFFGATFQQLGLVYTSAGKAGFITGLYVVIVPLLGMIWGDRAPIRSWIGALFAIAGLYFLSMSETFQLAPGDSYVLIGALFWAFHVQFLARFSPDVDPIELSLVQSLITAFLSFIVGFIVEDFDLTHIQRTIMPILYGGVISIGLAYTLQVVAQQDAKPSHAAIILSLESVFAVFWGWLFLNEVLTNRAFLGSGLMLGGMIISQIRNRQALN